MKVAEVYRIERPAEDGTTGRGFAAAFVLPGRVLECAALRTRRWGSWQNSAAQLGEDAFQRFEPGHRVLHFQQVLFRLGIDR